MEPGHTREIDRSFGLAGTHEDSTFAGSQRKDVTGTGEIARALIATTAVGTPMTMAGCIHQMEESGLLGTKSLGPRKRPFPLPAQIARKSTHLFHFRKKRKRRPHRCTAQRTESPHNLACLLPPQ